MEGSVMPCPRAQAEMDVFDALPADFRAFLAHYPRAAKTRQVAALLDENDGDVAAAIRDVRWLLPVRAA